MEEFVSARLSEQFAGLEYLRQRAERANREKFRTALGKIPDVDLKITTGSDPRHALPIHPTKSNPGATDGIR